MRRIAKLVSCLAVMLLLALCSLCEAGTKKHYNEENGFSIEYPDDWDVSQNKRNVSKTVIVGIDSSKATEDSFAVLAFVDVHETKDGVMLEEYFNSYLDFMRASYFGVKIHKQGDFSKKGVKAKWAIYDLYVGDNVVRNITYFIVNGKKAYHATGGSSSEGFSKRLKTFESILQTFEFNE
ncbi:MAG: hypothetical protein HY884_00120 [Deltaproteobacteria bacterium]|nr:hypothetical protein [Deltaproteobacteria bacterium]